MTKLDRIRINGQIMIKVDRMDLKGPNSTKADLIGPILTEQDQSEQNEPNKTNVD